MNLWLSSYFLAAGMFLSSSTLTPEECQPLITPLSLADPSMMLGRWNFLQIYTDNEFYIDLLKTIESCWINVTLPSSSPKTLIMSQENKINGTCLSAIINGDIEGNIASASYFNSTSAFHVLSSFPSFLVLESNSTIRNVDKMLRMMGMNHNVTVQDVSYRALYLLAKGTTVTVKDSDKEHFSNQARCLGFNREPDFIYDPNNGFCAEGEGRKMIGY